MLVDVRRPTSIDSPAGWQHFHHPRVSRVDYRVLIAQEFVVR